MPTIACALPATSEDDSDWVPEGFIAKDCVLGAVTAADLVSVVSKRLNPRQRYILEALARGFGEGEIAAALGIKRQAVARHRQKIAAHPAFVE